MPENKRSVREHALSGVMWNFVGQFGRQVITFPVSIVLARLLAPRDFGLPAVLFVFQEIANALINSGLNAPLVQGKRISQKDCSTVFCFNVGVGALCYALFVGVAPIIARFYREPELNSFIVYYGLIFLIYSCGNVQLGLLQRELNYRELNGIDLIGVAVSGVAAIGMARQGYGVYSLLGQQLSHALVTTGLYWLRSPWRPTASFSGESFRRLFGFGSKVLVVSLLDKALNAVDNLIIGRLQGTTFAGLYSRGKNTRELPIGLINGVISTLIFPLFSRIADPTELKNALGRFLGFASYVTAPLMVGMALVSEPLISVVYSETWRPAAPFLQLFCLFGITVPLNTILVQTVMSQGHSGEFLRLELRKKVFLLVALATGAFLPPRGLVWALCAAHYVMLFASVRSVARLLGISATRIAKDLLPGVALAILMAGPVYLTRQLSWHSEAWELAASIGVGVASYWGLSMILGSRDYLFARGLIMERLRRASS